MNDKNFLKNKIIKGGKGNKSKKGKVIDFASQIFVVIFIFALLTFAYTSFTYNKNNVEVPISEFASMISKGDIKSISVEGDKVISLKDDNTEVISKKETGVSILDTLKNYGVKEETLSQISVEVKGESGASFWLSMLPVFLPILFLILMIWWLARGIKGANVQALSFGQSKAKIIYPDDTKNKILFKDKTIILYYQDAW